MWPTFFWTHNLNNSMCHQFLHSLLSTAEKRVSPFSQSAFSSRCRFRNRIYLLCLEDGHGHALISPEASNHLSDDIGRFSEILTPADAGACQEVLDETYSDVVTPMKARRGVGGEEENIKLILSCNETEEHMVGSNIWQEIFLPSLMCWPTEPCWQTDPRPGNKGRERPWFALSCHTVCVLFASRGFLLSKRPVNRAALWPTASIER